MNQRSHQHEYELRICRAIDFINQHLAESPSVNEIAAAAPFSPFHFQRLFRALTGESVAEFTRRLRLEAAAKKLTFGGMTDITGLAIELGFSSSQNFAKAFKKHFGLSPSAYQTAAGPLVKKFNPKSKPPVSNLFDLSQVVVRHVEEIHTVYRRHFGSYNSAEIQTAFDELQNWAEARELHHEHGYIGIPWDEATITPDDKCRFDACLMLQRDVWLGRSVNQQNIPAGRYATLRCEVVANNFDDPWNGMLRDWLPGSGFQPDDGPRFEVYFSDGSTDPDGRWELEIYLPVKPL